VSRLYANDRYTRLAKSPVQPFEQRTGLDPGEIDDAGPLPQTFHERLGLARYLALPKHPAVAVDDAHAVLASDTSSPMKTPTEGLQVSWLIQPDGRKLELGSDYPS
jgi:hypothetical protein